VFGDRDIHTSALDVDVEDGGASGSIGEGSKVVIGIV
jgi:hypothetical protein